MNTLIEISDAGNGPEAEHQWNQFVEQNYPPIGAFMQTWEWGNFQKELGREIGRYVVTIGNERIAAFTLVHYKLPLGMSYGYAPRGPVISKKFHGAEKEIALFNAIRDWAKKKFPQFIFLRLEPPLKTLPEGWHDKSFRFPSRYIQPRYNLAIPLEQSEDDIAKMFHHSTRSNLRRAERRGVTVVAKPGIAEDDYQNFSAMKEGTIQRNSGTNAYPSEQYFRAFLKTIPATGGRDKLMVGSFCGYQNGEPASVHFVLFFGDTATYLYGASHTKHLNSKVDTYLHWQGILEAKRRGFHYYDLGGIDPARWPSLTEFKRQFRGTEFEYVGNIDIPIQPSKYLGYSLFRKFGK